MASAESSAREAARARAASSARGELDREREAVEAAADLFHGRAGSDFAPDWPGALGEERGGLLLRERLEPVFLFARDAERRLGS